MFPYFIFFLIFWFSFLISTSSILFPLTSFWRVEGNLPCSVTALAVGLDVICSAQVFLCPDKLLTCINLQNANSIPQRLSMLSRAVTFWLLLPDKTTESRNAFWDDPCHEFCSMVAVNFRRSICFLYHHLHFINLRLRQIEIAWNHCVYYSAEDNK